MSDENRNALIEARIDIDRNTEISISSGVNIANMAQAFEIAKAMAISGPCVPRYLRGNPGSCLYIIMRADRWGIDPFALAEKSYAVTNKGEERIAFESSVFRTVVEALALGRDGLQHRFEGEGDDRVCIVWGTLRGQSVSKELKSSPLGVRRPQKNEYGAVKGSPLWVTKPDVQQVYDTQRDWVRVYCPGVMLGAYSVDELQEAGFEVVDKPSSSAPQVAAADQVPLHHRLSAKAAVGAGFDAAGVVATLNEVSGRAAETPAPVETAPLVPAIREGAQAAPETGASSPVDPSLGAAEHSSVELQGTATELSTSEVSPPASEAGAEVQRPPPSEPEQTPTIDEDGDPLGSYEEPKVPKDGKDFVAYVSKKIFDPALGTHTDLRAWWNSAESKKFRNGLVNLSPEAVDEAKLMVSQRIDELKSKAYTESLA